MSKAYSAVPQAITATRTELKVEDNSSLPLNSRTTTVSKLWSQSRSGGQATVMLDKTLY